MNFHQRCFTGPDYSDFTVFCKKDAKLTDDLASRNIRMQRFNAKSDLMFLFKLLYHVKEFKNMDVVMSYPGELVVVALLAKYLYKTKVVLDIWDIPFRDPRGGFSARLKRKLKIFFFRPLFARADLFIAVSALVEFQLKEFRLPAGKMGLYLNAIFLDEYRNLPVLNKFEVFTILIQKSVFRKGVGVGLMLDAFGIILTKVDARLLIVGEVLHEVMEDIKKFPHQERIELTGFVPHHRFNELALRSHVCAVPFPKVVDLEQTYPVKVIEYMALGKAIVATRIAGLVKLIGNAGILVDPITPEAFAEQIIRLYENPELRLQLEDRARLRASEFDARKKNGMIFKEILSLCSAEA